MQLSSWAGRRPVGVQSASGRAPRLRHTWPSFAFDCLASRCVTRGAPRSTLAARARVQRDLPPATRLAVSSNYLPCPRNPDLGRDDPDSHMLDTRFCRAPSEPASASRRFCTAAAASPASLCDRSNFPCASIASRISDGLVSTTKPWNAHGFRGKGQPPEERGIRTQAHARGLRIHGTGAHAPQRSSRQPQNAHAPS